MRFNTHIVKRPRARRHSSGRRRLRVMFHTYKQPDFDNRIYSSVHVYGLLAKTRKPLPPAFVVSMPIYSPREVGVVIFQCVTVHERFCNDAVGLVYVCVAMCASIPLVGEILQTKL